MHYIMKIDNSNFCEKIHNKVKEISFIDILFKIIYDKYNMSMRRNENV